MRFQKDLSLAEQIETTTAAINAEKALARDQGFLIVSDIEEEDVSSFIINFKEKGYWVSDPVNTGKFAIVWDKKALDGFIKSGFYFG